MQGSACFAKYEGTGVGIDHSTSEILFQNYSFNSALWMMALDFVVYFTLGLYMDKVIPSDYGQRLSPWFLCTPSYYRCYRTTRRRRNSVNEDGTAKDALMSSEDGDRFESEQMPENNYEAPPVICKRFESSNEYLRIENL